MIFLFARISCGVAFFQIAHLAVPTMSKGFDAAASATAVSVFGAATVASALVFAWLSDRYGPARMLALWYFVRGIGRRSPEHGTLLIRSSENEQPNERQ